MGYVYLLHFSRPICPGHPCRHYLGYTSRTLAQRLAEHRSGRGARLVEVATERGIDFVVARTWKGNRQLERTLKNRKNSPELCPLCNPRIDPGLLPRETPSRSESSQISKTGNEGKNYPPFGST